MARHQFAGAAPQTHTTAQINSSVLSVTVSEDASSYPDGSIGPFVIVFDRDGANPEKALCSARSGNTFTITNRGYDGTTAGTHGAGVTVDHILDAAQIDLHDAHAFDTTRDDHTQYAPVPASNDEVLYVSTSGNDSHNGRSPGRAFLTIGAAMSAVAAGGTVKVGAGTFTGGVTFPHNNVTLDLRAGTTVTIANNANVPVVQMASVTGCRVLGGVLDGNKANNTAPGASGNHGVYINGDDCTVDGTTIQNVYQNGVEVEVCNRPTVTKNTITGCNGSAIRFVATVDDGLIAFNNVRNNVNGIFVYANTGLASPCHRTRIIGNNVDTTTSTNGALAQDGGIAINGCPDTVISNNVIHACTGRGIHVFGSCPGAVITGNKVTSCGSTNHVSGIDLGDNTSDVDYLVANNYVSGSGASGIFVSGVQRAVVTGNICKNNGQSTTDTHNANGITVNEGSGTGAAPINDCLIAENQCYDDQGAGQTQLYGIREWSGVASYYNRNVYRDNNVNGNKTGAMLLVGTGATLTATRNNPGYNPLGMFSVSVTASPFSYSASTCPETVYIDGGVVSQIAVGGTQVYGSTGHSVHLEPGITVVITYSVAPTVTTYRE